MTQRLPSLLLGCAMLLLVAQTVQAQVVRPSNTVYLQLRGGATAYGGELDRTGAFADPQNNRASNAWLTSDLGWYAGAELGYQFTPSLGFGLGFQYGSFTNLDGQYPSPTTGAVGQINDTKILPTATAAFRYMPFPTARLSPYANLGAQLTFGSDRPMGYGPYLGLGLDAQLSPRVSFFVEANGSFIFPDDAVDGVDPGAALGAGSTGDNADFDNLVYYGAGLRFAFRAPFTRVQIESLQCPAQLTVGQSGSFMAMTNANASQPVTVTWNWGDGRTGTGMQASHAYTAPGTYTVTATASNQANTVTDTCVVTVVEPVVAPTLSACRATPAQVNPGQAVEINATVAGTQPVQITVDFGDGTTANSLPARHTYQRAGNYTVTIRATNSAGTNSCTIQVRVGDAFCDQVTELNTVFFGYNSATLTAEARSRLDENIEVLRRCPELGVRIDAYADDREGDKVRLSQRRADAVRAYYIANGIAENRILAQGLGENPTANSKEDPGPGDSRARLARSIPVRNLTTFR